MAAWISLINFSMSIAALMLMVLGLLLSVIVHKVERKTKQFFICFFTLMILYVLCNLLGQIMYLFTDRATATQLLLFLESLFSSVLMPLLSLYMLHSCGEDWKHNPVLDITLFLWLIYFMLLLVTQFTTGIYYFTPDNAYHRGPWYPLLLLPPILIMGFNLVMLFRRRDRLSRKHFSALLIYFVAPMVSMLIQMACYGLYSIVLGTAFAAMFLFLFILMDQVEQDLRRQEENALQRASIMVLQMRPHFIYNTLTSIYYLCRQDAEKAQQTILDFTTYLRKNFSAIARAKTIPFLEELEHTRAYLAVEQIRFENHLIVHFDTPHTMFHLPPLTLQPLVENAVKHGMDPETAPLEITIRTAETENGSRIVIMDTGPGYEPVSDDRTHIALDNIRERLEMMCGGSLTITSRESGGTVVTIEIPEST